MSTPWLGISSAACFSSARAARAEMQVLSTARVSSSVAGGSGGRALKDSSGRHSGRLGGHVRTDDTESRYVAAIDTSTRHVDKTEIFRHKN